MPFIPIIIIILVVVLILVLATNLKVVQQSKAYVIERLGAFHSVWGVGIHFKVPFLERVAKVVSLKEQVVDFRHVVGVRYRLLPYIYSEYMKAALNDDMYFKPLAFVYPEDKMARRIEDQLILGNEIMITPVYEQNGRGGYK